MDKQRRGHLLDGYVLHRRDYGNSSLLLELFTRSQGRYPAIAKGAKRPGSALAALLQPFRPLLVGVSGRGEVKTLTQAEPSAESPTLAGQALFCGFYLNELLVRLLARGDSHERLYDHYRTALAELAAGPEAAGVLRRFERRLLGEAGYAMVLEREAGEGPPLRPELRYQYHPEQGPQVCAADAPGFTVAGATLLALAADLPLRGEAAREARELMRRVLAHHLGERPLKSRELFRQLLPKGP
jgi:DNA repair protein RecO (recombination protein O)